MRILKGPIAFFAPDTESHLEPQAHERESGEEQQQQQQREEQSPDYDKRKSDFMSRFSASRNAPTSEGGKIDSKPNLEAAETLKQNEIRAQQERERQKAEVQKKPFIKQQIEAKRTAEQERDEFKAKAEQHEKAAAELQAKINDLQAKIDSGDFSEKKEKEFQQKIDQLEIKAKEERDALVNENEKLKSRLRYHDLSEDEQFQKEYVNPVYDAYKSAAEILGQDKGALQSMDRALSLNAVALRAATPEERSRAEAERDTVLSAIADNLNQFASGRFTSAINDYIKASFKHAKALKDHETTIAEIKKKAISERNKAHADRLATWDKTYKATADSYAEYEKLTAEEIKLAKELKIDPVSDLAKMDSVARKTLTGEAAMEDTIELIHRGRVMPVLEAKIKILQKELSDRDAVISKLRGAGTTGGDSSSSGSQGAKQTREEWQRKFSASRAM